MQKDLSILGAHVGHLIVTKQEKSSPHGDALFTLKCEICGKEHPNRRGTEIRRKIRDGKAFNLCCDLEQARAKRAALKIASAERAAKARAYYDLKNNNKLLYYTWQGMKARCYRKTHCKYKDYGARGIYVCNEWRNNFLTFLNWALSNGYRPQAGLSIDRINNDDGYRPDNCRWATYSQQNTNKRKPAPGSKSLTKF